MTLSKIKSITFTNVYLSTTKILIEATIGIPAYVSRSHFTFKTKHVDTKMTSWKRHFRHNRFVAVIVMVVDIDLSSSPSCRLRPTATGRWEGPRWWHGMYILGIVLVSERLSWTCLRTNLVFLSRRSVGLFGKRSRRKVPRAWRYSLGLAFDTNNTSCRTTLRVFPKRSNVWCDLLATIDEHESIDKWLNSKMHEYLRA